SGARDRAELKREGIEMETITHGGVGLTRLEVTDGVSINVRAPGLHVEWRSVAAVPKIEAVPGAENAWSRAISSNGLKPFAAMEARPLAVEMSAAAPSLAQPESADAFVEMRAAPPSGEGLLVMVESHGVVQWYLPTNAPRVVKEAATVGTESVRAPELHFMIPRSTLSRGGATTAFTEDVSGAVVRF